ncbi:hypothetical protein MTR67_052069 [Solanum verrucosum]|uniref:Integrase catalytic domain-containing protein n=1 Tax=Solanum verrucosum TaxID=315347 RepID=A0AAF1A387_SOLVR|nr:hypothetical protein MTR67_052069 [Solanum verrucosum]
MIYCDASRVILGCVLMQRNKVITFPSRQLKRRWLEFLKNYDMNVLYHPGKANVVVDALSRLSMGSLAHVEEEMNELAKDVHRLARLGVCLMNISGDDVIVQNRSECSLVEEVEVEHQKPGGMTQEINLPTGKLELINMDFITDSVEDYDKLYIKEIVRLHGVLLSIISNRGPQFTFHFWKSFQKGLCSLVNLSLAFHPQTNGKAEGTIQTLEDMLGSCLINFKGSWNYHLSLIEFTYNNCYHFSIQMALYESLYGCRCRSLVGDFEVSEATLLGPDSVHVDIDKV